MRDVRACYVAPIPLATGLRVSLPAVAARNDRRGVTSGLLRRFARNDLWTTTQKTAHAGAIPPSCLCSRYIKIRYGKIVSRVYRQGAIRSWAPPPPRIWKVFGLLAMILCIFPFLRDFFDFCAVLLRSFREVNDFVDSPYATSANVSDCNDLRKAFGER
jgi:hypothetical protein